ncbi:hypothetical protein [Demequina salsinemoris]|uniref:hypothetical protein n=1 Tax=Demequina salsinemoris TaxID=577470 RepID=UPI0007813A63|nr:hypothetical protein [Demequina salsinemoris]
MNARRIAAVVVGAMALVGASALALHAGVAARTDATRESIIASLEPGQTWTLESENTRTTGPLGLCLVGVLDVRPCSSTHLHFAVPLDQSLDASSLAALLPGLTWTGNGEECGDVPTNFGGTLRLCELETEVDGFTVEAWIAADIELGGIVDGHDVVVAMSPVD